MKAAVFHAAHTPLTIEDVVIEKPKRREVLLRTAYAGLCHSDLHFMEGLYPYPTPAVLGHEGAAVVEAVGEGVEHRVKVTCRAVVLLRRGVVGADDPALGGSAPQPPVPS